MLPSMLVNAELWIEKCPCPVIDKSNNNWESRHLGL